MKVKIIGILLVFATILTFTCLVGVVFLIILSFIFNFEYDSAMKLVQLTLFLFLGIIMLIPLSLLGSALEKVKGNSRFILIFSEVIQFMLFLYILTNMNQKFGMVVFQHEHGEILFFLFIYLIIVGVEYFGEKLEKVK